MRSRLIAVAMILSLLAGTVAGQKKDGRSPAKTPDSFRGVDEG